MSIVKLSCATISGAINFVTDSNEEIRISKDNKAQVIAEGYIGAGRVEKTPGSGDYVASAFGRLPLKAAVAGAKGTPSFRLVLDVAGGLRGVLFVNDKKEKESDPDYTGRLEVDDLEYPLFGRKVGGQSGEFISLNSLEAKPRQQNRSHQDDSQNDSSPF